MRASEGKIAIYSRKSKFTGKGESIGNQIELCREYIRANHGQADADAAAVYEDEGFSGGNLERPAFKRMLRAAPGAEIQGGRCVSVGPHQPEHQRFFGLDRRTEQTGYRFCFNQGAIRYGARPWGVR